MRRRTLSSVGRLRAVAVAGLIACGAVGEPEVAAQSGDAPTLTDIVEARSIDSLVLSPDGQRLAFRVIERSVARNSTTAQWYWVPMGEPAAPVALGSPTEPIWVPLFDFIENGDAQWDPGSTTLYVRQAGRHGIQVHRLGPQGADRTVTEDPADVVSFSISDDGKTISYKTRNTREAIANAAILEQRMGIHLDRTLVTDGLPLINNFRIGGSKASLRRSGPSEVLPGHSGALATKSVAIPGRDPVQDRPAKGSVDQRSVYTSLSAETGLGFKLASQRTAVSLETVGAMSKLLPVPKYELTATSEAGVKSPCREVFCVGFSYALRQVVPNESNGEIVVLYEADEAGRSVLYGWNPLTGRSRTIYDHRTALDGGSSYAGSPCRRSGRYLACVEAGPTQPPELVRIDMETGERVTLSDPNRLLARKAFAAAELLSWTDESGRPANGVLMRPKGASTRHPLVITTYRCRGFLQGGTGSVVPEHILVQRGIATLCVNTRSENIAERGPDGHEILLGVHKASIESYRSAINLLSRSGVIDPAKVGISGHSYSSNVVAYALSNTNLFAAATLGTGVTIDPNTYYLTAPVPDSWRKSVLRSMALPEPTKDTSKVWNHISPSLNAGKITAPVLFLPPENEYLFGLQLYTSLRDAGGIADMYIFPGEGHSAGREPIHRYWRYRRALDWFAFWLTQREYASPDTVDQYRGWRELREARNVTGHLSTQSPEKGVSTRIQPRPPHQPDS